jgi:paraquat-inducible protein A
VEATDPTLRACRTCGLIQAVPPPRRGVRAHCARCDSPVPRGIDQRWTIAAAVGALLLYPLAMSLPVLSVERFGVSNATDIWHGALRLLSDGHLVVGLIVIVCSVIVPLTKLIGLLALSATPRTWRARHRAVT